MSADWRDFVKSALSKEDRFYNDVSSVLSAIEHIRDGRLSGVKKNPFMEIPGFPRMRFDRRADESFFKRERWNGRAEKRISDFFNSQDSKSKRNARRIAKMLESSYIPYEEKEPTNVDKYINENLEPEFVYGELAERGISEPTMEDVKSVVKYLKSLKIM